MRLVGEADHVTRQLTSLVSLSQCISSVRPLSALHRRQSCSRPTPYCTCKSTVKVSHPPSIAASLASRDRGMCSFVRRRVVNVRPPEPSQSDSFNHVHIPRTDGRTEADGGATRGRGDTTAICAAAAATRKVAGCGAAPRFLEILPSHGTILALHFPSIVVPSTFFAAAVIWREKAAVVGRIGRCWLRPTAKDVVSCLFSQQTVCQERINILKD